MKFRNRLRKKLKIRFRLDNERRSVAHYLAWMGKEESLSDILQVVPTFANYQDIDGETPLMLAVR